jgi:hypothetical protein
MHRTFGQIPNQNTQAASDIVKAARHVDSLMTDEFDPDIHKNSDSFKQEGINIPDVNNSEELVEEVYNSSIPVSPSDDEESHDGATGGVVEGGIEYLAFYKSFRDVMKAPAPKKWGIFFIKKRCIALATDMSFSTGGSFFECLDGLAAFLYAHELYHYRFDAHCLQMEATGGHPIYKPYRRLVSIRPMTEWHEESIANFYGLKALRSNRNFPYAEFINEYLRDLVLNSPGAYAGGADKQQGQRKDLMAQQASTVFAFAGPNEWKKLVESSIRIGMDLPLKRETSLGSFLSLDNCPVHWIDWVKGGKSVLTPFVASVSEVNNDFIKRYLAGTPDHQSKHSFCRIDNGEKVKLPNPHRADLTNREFHNIIGKAGMTSSQFYRERDRTSIWRKGVPRNPVLPPRFKSNK